ncbi:hypothetical protein TNIN_387721, partial [Trichonephila inaurata madagascariensis]
KVHHAVALFYDLLYPEVTCEGSFDLKEPTIH